MFSFLTIFLFFAVFISLTSYYFPYNAILDGIHEDLFNETNEFKKVYTDNSINFEDFLRLEIEEEGENNLFIEVLNENKKIFSSAQKNTPFKNIKNYKIGEDYEFFYATFNKNPDKYMILKRFFKDGLTITIGKNLNETINIFNILKFIIISINFISFFIVTITILLITKKILSPIKELSDFTVSISEKKDINLKIDYSNFPLEIYNFADNFQKMLNKIKILIKETEEISNNIAHDIKTPLTNIKMTVEKLMSDESISPYQEDLIFIFKNLDRTTYIINAILSASKTISDITKLDNDKVNLLEISKDAYELFTEIAQSKNICLSLHYQEDEYFINGNLKAVQRIVSNILDNSIKYTKKNGYISISLFKNKNDIFLSIKDNGIGIPENEITLIFDKFYKIDKSRQSEGIGLGLSIVKSLVERLNAEIIVNSILGSGSEFVIKFKKSE